jgi:hypothetical protein
MPDSLPPDLARLGDELARATAASAGAERRRARRVRRLAATGLATAAAFAMLAPAALQRSDRTPFQLAAAAAIGYHPTACERPRGGTFAAVRPCASPGSTDVEPGSLARRLAEN